MGGSQGCCTRMTATSSWDDADKALQCLIVVAAEDAESVARAVDSKHALEKVAWRRRDVDVCSYAALSTYVRQSTARKFLLVPAGTCLSENWDYHFLQADDTCAMPALLACIGGGAAQGHLEPESVPLALESPVVDWLTTHAPPDSLPCNRVPATALLMPVELLAMAADCFVPAASWAEIVRQVALRLRNHGVHCGIAARVTMVDGPPDPDGEIASSLAGLRYRWREQQQTQPKLVFLHVAHSWGGGLEKWVRDFTSVNTDITHLVLRSIGVTGCYGQRVALFNSVDAQEPIRFWELHEPIVSIATAHKEYARIIEEIVEVFGVSRILISSLIGHALDVLLAAVPVTWVAHDFFPICPAIGLHFGTVCTHCDRDDLRRCAQDNPINRFFPDADDERWLHVRQLFVSHVLSRRIPLVAPSASVRRHYLQILPELASATWHVIPHGMDFHCEPSPAAIHTRPRILILGRLDPLKGLQLLTEMRDSLLAMADVHLVGCGELPKEWRLPGVFMQPVYAHQELPRIVGAIQPDLALLLSVVPETFSYTLEELRRLSVPVLATRVGSFVDRIEDGKSGFLADPDAGTLLSRVRQLLQEKTELSGVREFLGTIRHRTLHDMVADYLAIQSARPRWPDDSTSGQRSPWQASPGTWHASAGFSHDLYHLHASILRRIDHHPRTRGVVGMMLRLALWAWVLPPRAAMWLWRRLPGRAAK